MTQNTSSHPPVVAKKHLVTFILVTVLFPLWGFANDITNPMVAAFKKILLITNFESSLVQAAFYGGYCFMAIPAALFIKKYSYKKGILVGLALYAGSALFFPIAGQMMAFWAFLLAYFTMTCGLSFLETTANPYILSMGSPETATRRLNLSQSFNPMGSICGMFVAMIFILSNLTSVKHDPELAPVLATEAHKLITEVTQAEEKSAIKITHKKLKPDTMSLDAVKWAKIQELGLGSWVGGQARSNIENSLEKKSDVNWDEALSLIQADHQRLAQSLAVISNTETTDAEKWQRLQAQSLDTTLTDKQRDRISGKIAKNKEVNWEQSPILDGSPDEEQARTLISKTDASQWTGIQKADLNVLQGPYFAIGLVVAVFFFIFLIKKLPEGQGEDDKSLHLNATFQRLSKNTNYVGGVIAQAFYVGVQIMVWTFIIQYAGNELGMRASTAQGYNIIAMFIFVSSRFICTFLLKYVSPGGLLSALAVGGGVLILGVIFIKGMPGLYCLIGVSACMSLMFPTIYGIALAGLGDDAKLGAAGLIMAIGGGCLMPPLQAAIMDKDAFQFGSMTLSSTRVSFVLPFICFVAIAIYGYLAHRKHIGEARS